MKRTILIYIFYLISNFKPSHGTPTLSDLQLQRIEKDVIVLFPAGYPLIQDDIAVTNYFGNTYVGFKTLKLNWMEANNKCKRHGMVLTTFDSKEEFEFQVDFITKNMEVASESYKEVWLGATDLYTEGNFTWIDSGKPFSSFYNAPVHQPDNKDGIENCVEFRKEPSDAKYWVNDIPCIMVSRFICKFIYT